MADVWFVLVGLMLTAYVVLDGFDLGAGALHRVVAKTDEERRTVIAAIGPYWDGNEVFLIAAGGTLFVAFAKVLGAVLSGLYLAVIFVLWLILLRGVAIEFRNHLRSDLWRAFWDVVFQLASGALAFLLGVALGNVVRGFPLGADGYFALELFSLESPKNARGVLDVYTFATGLLSFAVLVAHGARFLALKTEGELRERTTRIAQGAALPIVALWAVVTVLTLVYCRAAASAFLSRPAAWPIAVAAMVAFVVSWTRGRRGQVRAAFLASCTFVTSLVGLAAASVYPTLLRSTTVGVASMTTENASNGPGSLAAGLRWWFFALALVVAYFVNLFRIHRGPATGTDHE